jgi:uncharacterized protein
MKADVWQQHSLLELAEVDAELSRLAHRAKNLPEEQRLAEAQAAHTAATDALAVVRIALEDLDGQVAKLESEIDAVRQREDRDRALLDNATTAKQITELQHELETLERRQASLEDSLLEIMERREELQTRQADESTRIDELQTALNSASHERNSALAEVEQARGARAARREELVAAIDGELVSLYERQRARGGAGAGALQGKRCGACRIEIDRGELARISAAAEDEVLRCPECGAILLRVQGFGR